MDIANQGDTVRIHYTGWLEDESIFDTTQEREPIQFVIGDGAILPPIEQSLVGMKIGDRKTLTLPPEEGFGVPRNDMFFEINKTELPQNIAPEVGMQLVVNKNDGGQINVRVADIGEEKVRLDANHPLAGHTVTIDLELVEIM